MQCGRLALALVVALVAVQPALGRTGVIDEVTLFADRTLVEPRQSLLLRGSIDSARRGEIVEIEVKDCGQRSFRGVAAATTEQGGEWRLELWPGISTTIRAVWKNDASIQIPIRQKAWVTLRKTRSGPLEVDVTAKTPFWRKRVILQRRAGGSWRPVRQIMLTEQIAAGSTGVVLTRARFPARLPTGTPVRAVLPLSEARPCYLAGVSNTVRA